MTIAARVIQTIVRLVAVAAFFFIGRNGTWAADQPSKLTPVRVAVVSRSTLDMPFFIARDQGLFREEGLEVELIFMKAIQTVQALLAGGVDFGTATGTASVGGRGSDAGAPLEPAG